VKEATTSKLTLPSLTPEELEGLKLYWEVYEAHREDIHAELLRNVYERPELKFILEAGLFVEPMGVENGSTELQRRAIFQ
jgi:hypothetical protein